MKWIAFFSQTGTEIVNLCRYMKRKPNLIIYNNIDIPQKIKDLNVEVKTVPNKPTVSDYIKVLPKDNDVLITLHGWLRIIPKEICEKYKGKIYNGHPGLIDRYPELKGKDPQIRTYKRKYEYGGSVVHEVTPEVDSGKIIISVPVKFEKHDLDYIFEKLRYTSLKAWLIFFHIKGLYNGRSEYKIDKYK